MTSPADLPSFAEIPGEVTVDRVGALLSSRGFVPTQEGTFRGQTDTADVEVTMPPADGVVVLFRGTRRGEPFAPGRLRDLEAFVNDWHREHVWPTVVLATGERGVAVHAHVGVDATAGLTQAQLVEYVRIGVGTIEQCFGRLSEWPGLAESESSEDPDA